MSTYMKLTLPLYFFASLWNMGLNCLQGGHHVAEKSTTTGIGCAPPNSRMSLGPSSIGAPSDSFTASAVASASFTSLDVELPHPVIIAPEIKIAAAKNAIFFITYEFIN